MISAEYSQCNNVMIYAVVEVRREYRINTGGLNNPPEIIYIEEIRQGLKL